MNNNEGVSLPPFVIKINSLKYKISGFQILNIPFLEISFRRILLVKGVVGAGKTHLLKIIAGALNPSEGGCEITRNGKRVESLFIHSNPEFNFVTGRIADEMKLMGLAAPVYEHSNKDVSDFSGGQLKKISIEMGIACQKELLIMDEPFNMLDDDELLIMRENILENSSYSGFIITAHENIIDEYADKILVMENGSFI